MDEHTQLVTNLIEHRYAAAIAHWIARRKAVVEFFG